MEISSAVTLLTQSIGIVKQLRDIDKSYDASLYKSQVAELYTNLADLKMALSDAREDLHEKDQEIVSLNKRIEELTSGEACPICGEGKMKTIQVSEHPMFGEVGVQEKQLQCEKCAHTEKRMHDPSNMLKKNR